MAKQQLEAGTVFKGPCGALSESPWLTSETLPQDRDTVVTIEAVMIRRNVTFEKGGKKETKKIQGSLKFVGRERELGLNTINRKILATLFGGDTSAWFGKKIALYVDPNVSAFGNVVCGIRIRAKRIDAATPDAPPPQEPATERGEEKADPPLQ